MSSQDLRPEIPRSLGGDVGGSPRLRLLGLLLLACLRWSSPGGASQAQGLSMEIVVAAKSRGKMVFLVHFLDGLIFFPL